MGYSCSNFVLLTVFSFALFLQVLVLAECNSNHNHNLPISKSKSPSLSFPTSSVQLDVPDSIASISGGGARGKASTGTGNGNGNSANSSVLKHIFAYGDDESSSKEKSRKPIAKSSASASASPPVVASAGMSALACLDGNERAFLIAVVMMLVSPYTAPYTEEFYKYVNKGIKYSFQKAADVGDEIIVLLEDLGDEILHLIKLTGSFFANTSMAVSAFIFTKIDETLAAIADLGYEIRLAAMKIVSPIANLSQMATGSSVGAAKSLTHAVCNASRNTKNFIAMCGRETVWFIEDALDFTIDNIQAAASSAGKLMRSACRNFFSGAGKAANCISSCVLYSDAAIRAALMLAKEECVSFSGYVAKGVVKGTEAVCNCVAAAVCYAAEKFVDGLESTAIFIADGFEWTLFAIFLAFSQFATFVKTVCVFLATSVVFYAETAASIAGTTAKKVANGVNYVREEFPEWVLDFADAMPFLEIRENDDIALTKTAQSVLFLATAVVAFQPFINPEPEADMKNKYGFRKAAYETIKSRFFPSQRLVLFGALARGLHQQSSFTHTFQPSLGAGALMNIGGVVLDERWVSFVMAGWFASGQIWTFFGAEAPSSKSFGEGQVGIMEKKKGWGWLS